MGDRDPVRYHGWTASVGAPRHLLWIRACLALTNLINWMFRNRRTGRLTIVQVPNLSLFVYLVATALRLLASPQGGLRTAVDLVAGVTLFWWAGDEVIRGVNPFRRILGATALAAMIIKLLR